MKKRLFIILSLGIFVMFNYAIYEKEQIKAKGETVLLELAPVDPRSLMQGDYMRLRYAIEPGISDDLATQAKRGDMVIVVDDNHVGRFVRFHHGESLQPGEKLLHYHYDYGTIHIVPDSFMFQEGQAPRYQNAKFGVFKFDDAGGHVLVGLADDRHQVIQPN